MFKNFLTLVYFCVYHNTLAYLTLNFKKLCWKYGIFKDILFAKMKFSK
jgi:hypothetical protein